MNNKIKYVKPELKAHGSVEDVTRATSSGAKFDGNFNFGQTIPPNIAMS